MPVSQPVVDEAMPITPESEEASSDPVLGAEDLAKIDQEVEKRLDEQRRRLEAQSATPPPAASPSTAAPKEPEPRIVEQAPPPQPQQIAARLSILAAGSTGFAAG